jgi:NmrA-like family protein
LLNGLHWKQRDIETSKYKTFRVLLNAGCETRAAAPQGNAALAVPNFANHTFVITPFYYQNLIGVLAPQKQTDGSVGWALPLDPTVRSIHMGNITELGDIVAGAFAHPDQAGHGEYLPLVGDFLSFNEVVGTLNRQGHNFSFNQVPKEVFAGLFPGAAEIAEMLSYFQAYTYLVRFRFARPNCARKQNRRAATDKVFGVGPGKFPGSKERSSAAFGLNNERRWIFAGTQVDFPLEHVRANGVPVPEEGEETKIGNDKSAVASFASIQLSLRRPTGSRPVCLGGRPVCVQRFQTPLSSDRRSVLRRNFWTLN